MSEGCRFTSLDEDHLIKINDEKDAKATKGVIAGAVQTLQEYLQVNNGQFKSLEFLETADMNGVTGILTKFYGER